MTTFANPHLYDGVDLPSSLRMCLHIPIFMKDMALQHEAGLRLLRNVAISRLLQIVATSRFEVATNCSNLVVVTKCGTLGVATSCPYKLSVFVQSIYNFKKCHKTQGSGHTSSEK